jgi:hypothetical protein
MNKSFNELIEETYNSLSSEELHNFILDAINYIKKCNVNELTDKQYEYYIKSVDVLKYCVHHNKISIAQFKLVNGFTKLISVSKVTYREF